MASACNYNITWYMWAQTNFIHKLALLVWERSSKPASYPVDITKVCIWTLWMIAMVFLKTKPVDNMTTGKKQNNRLAKLASGISVSLEINHSSHFGMAAVQITLASSVLFLCVIVWAILKFPTYPLASAEVHPCFRHIALLDLSFKCCEEKIFIHVQKHTL